MTILTVSQFTQVLKKKIEGTFSYVAIRGEVSNCKVQSSGHIYFTLKDQEAQISVVLFKGNTLSLSRPPKEGDQLIVKGELSVYAPRGNYQLIARALEFCGAGELLQKLHELKQKLEAKGWFAAESKQPLPQLPKTIGVVTSPTGAVIQDILHILTRRLGRFNLLLNPVKVQGEGAAQEIARAIDDFNRYQLADVLIVGRGGGSLEDLWPFNEECVAEAIHRSKIPIVSAVGHETDYSISDFVADLRAPTPSAAAELISIDKSGLLLQLSKTQIRLSQLLHAQTRTRRKQLQLLMRQPPLSSPLSLLNPYRQQIDETRESLDFSMNTCLSQRRSRIQQLSKQLELVSPIARIGQTSTRLTHLRKEATVHILQQTQKKREQLNRLIHHLRAVDPRHLLSKGYAIVFREKEGSVILSSKGVQAGDRLLIQLGDGKLAARVENEA